MINNRIIESEKQEIYTCFNVILFKLKSFIYQKQKFIKIEIFIYFMYKNLFIQEYLSQNVYQAIRF